MKSRFWLNKQIGFNDLFLNYFDILFRSKNPDRKIKMDNIHRKTDRKLMNML